MHCKKQVSPGGTHLKCCTQQQTQTHTLWGLKILTQREGGTHGALGEEGTYGALGALSAIGTAVVLYHSLFLKCVP